MRFIALLVLAATVLAQAQEAERATPRGLLKRGLLPKGKATTTTTTPTPAQDESEYVDEAEYPAEGAEGGEAAEGEAAATEAPASSTEGKRIGAVRPFRSNTDLLETLKRRRAQAAQAKHGISVSTAAPNDEPTEAPVKATYKKKGYGSGSRDEEVPASAQSKPARNRFGRPGKSVAPEPEEVQEPAAPAAPVRTGRTFSRLRN